MIVEENLKNLEVVVRGGGKLTSHRPVFNSDGSLLHIIQSSTILTYSTATTLFTQKYTTPGSTPIANIHVKPDDSILIFTQTGTLLTLNPSTNTATTTLKVNLSPAHWIPITNFINFLHPSDEFPDVNHFLAVGYPQDAGLPVLYSITGEGTITKVCWSIVGNLHSVALSKNGRFVVAIQEGTLFCKDMRDVQNCKWHSSGTRKLTCVAVHPTVEFSCATGDDTGRVLIWSNVMVEKSPSKTVFHWHTLPVVDLVFSPEGSQMFSGGGECTLVKWDTQDSTNKRTLPRMGLPICHVSVSGEGIVAVSHVDNCIQIVDEYSKVVGVVKNFTCGVDGEEGSSYDSGINVDPNNGCLVMNGRPGWLQCYDYRRNRNVYDLDVCQQNYVTNEREGVIPNGVVTVVGFSKLGTWMGTGERRVGVDGGVSESRIKFWKRDEVRGVWVLNTCVDWPHSQGVRGLRFRNTIDGDLSVVSCGGKEIKVWGVHEVDSVVGCTEYWVCEHVKEYKGLGVGGACYSSDGSLVCGAFGRVVAVWGADEMDFKLSLCHQRLRSDIKLIEFGENINSHLVLCCSDEATFVWDVITASLLWVVNIKLECVGVDRLSTLVGGSSGADLYVFSLENARPLRVIKDASKSRIQGVGWISGGGGGVKSSCVFLNGSDEVCGLVKGGGDMEVEEVKVKDERVNGVGVSVAEVRVSGVKEGGWGGWKVHGSEKGYSILREIMDCSPHTMPSAKFFARSLLQSLSVRVNENDRLLQMEELVMSSGRSQKQEIQDNEPEDMSCNLSEEDKWSRVDLDEIASEDTSWISNVFK